MLIGNDFIILGHQGDDMILTEEQRKRGVPDGVTLWPRVSGEVEIPFVLNPDCKFI